jgi:RNA polymerase sigma-70 factor (ECF subfamily)
MALMMILDAAPRVREKPCYPYALGITERDHTLVGPKHIGAERDELVLAFRQVYDAYFAFVWRAVANRGVPREALDDAVQEVFLVVHRKLPEFEGRSSIRTWLAGIVRRVVADHVKRRRNQAAGTKPLDDEIQPIDVAPEPAVELERRAAAALVDGLLAKMSETQREVFVLYELEEMTAREIAELTASNENTVQTRLRAARKIFEQGLLRHRAQTEGKR